MGRSDASGSKDIVVGRAALVEGANDRRLVVGDDAGLRNPDANGVQVLAQVLKVDVLGAPRQNLVADDEDAGGDGFGWGQAGLL